jgi:hypothetical protein
MHVSRRLSKILWLLFWTQNLQKMLQDKTSLRDMNTKDLKVGSTHLVWTSLPSNVADTLYKERYNKVQNVKRHIFNTKR